MRPTPWLSPPALLCLLSIACEPGQAMVGGPNGNGGPHGASDSGEPNGNGGATDGGSTDGGSTDGGAAALPASCWEILAADRTAASGSYEIDLDGAGGRDPFQVRCDMDTDGGSWTVFWWYQAGALSDSGWSGVDVLGGSLWSCGVEDTHCFARLPTPVVDELLVVGDDHWATWTIDSANTTSAAAMAAFVHGESTAYSLDHYTDAWNPVRQSSPDRSFPSGYACNSPSTYTGDGRGCAHFWYDSISGTASFDLDDDGGYGQTAFAAGADNAGYRGVDAFEVDAESAHNSRSRSLRLAWR